MDTSILRQEHAVLLRSASRLAGLAATLQNRADAVSVRALIDGMNDNLVNHLTKEDTQLYPQMMAYDAPELQTMAREAFEDMGLLHGRGWPIATSGLLTGLWRTPPPSVPRQGHWLRPWRPASPWKTRCCIRRLSPRP